MLHDGFANSCEQLSRRVLLAPLAIEYQFVIRAKEKVDPDLPLAATPRVKMRRQMVRGVEPEIQAFQDNDLYLSHARLGFVEPPEYEYTSYRTDWQSIALDRCPVLLTSGSESAFIGSLRPPGEDGPKIFVFKRLERVGDWCFEQGSGRSKIPKWDSNP
jgi:hypothetical protein